ncbi:MAG: YceI family protein [Candidatus Omnitrophica bacterium]|nr:YceI family protein [Candidatus Omnitrophota bacterium]
MNIRIILLAVVLWALPVNSSAQPVYEVILEKSNIKSKVRYTLVGTYEAEFKEFSGKLYFDPKNLADSKVELSIQTKSLKSKYSTLDRIARSRRLLDAAAYPNMSFKSQRIYQKGGQYYVKGIFSLHGVEKELTFPFMIEGPITDYSLGKYVVAEGKWRVNRKDFGIMWHSVLDKGGVVVADDVIIEWTVFASQRMD